jgi:rhodanese-related sulfurtransferase
MAKRNKKSGKYGQWLVMVGALITIFSAVFLAARNSNAADNTMIAKISPQQYVSDFENAPRPHLLLDVRTPEEFASGHIPGAVNIAVESLMSRLSEVPQNQPVVVYCRSGNRSATAAQILSDAGYANIYDMGAIFDWQAAGLPIE